ncbi:hypothetical protein ABOM_006726 [Aspergillus bombycis]|uniref:Uncharacterized protein n=1 Tax=Aspergillus bombycis TaxID=109264 RepID=A0A1F7ZYF0_9EURO|nr:hypothetical protein ABOM_006726 [Aspergillus bombycis]OGM44481.1 hypothetical protein ABOM_006726 [Aspergillus bombycis]
MLSEKHQLSTQMREPIQTKSASFYLACRMVSSVDLIYWEMLDEFCWGPRVSVAERVRSFTTNVGIHSGREDFVRSKISQLKEYYAELGEDIDIDYEEDRPNSPLKENSPIRETPQISSKRRAGLTATAVGFILFTMAVGTLRKYYRS